MNISIIGTGYVGLVTGTCLASLGNNVICMDNDKEKIRLLNKGDIPIFEPGLRDMVELNAKEHRLSFTDSMQDAVKASEVTSIAVGTPDDGNGKADLKQVLSVAKEIGRHMERYTVIVDKSTVPVGTADKVREAIGDKDCDVVSNPEFLREGEAIKDFMNPDRIIIGSGSDAASRIMKKIYSGIERTGKPILFTDVKSAELIKYASNAMLATRISFMNMLAPLCETVGADVKTVAKGMGLDDRIGPRFLQAGLGYGGSCFPKDVRALAATLAEHGLGADLLIAVDRINEAQKRSLLPKIKKTLGSLNGKTIAVWGLAFKPKTDDMREAPSITIIKQLQAEGAKIRAYDPVASDNTKKLVDISFGDNPYDTVKGCDALIISTEWDLFRQLDMRKVKLLLKNPIILDGRNIYDPQEMRSLGFTYISVGRT